MKDHQILNGPAFLDLKRGDQVAGMQGKAGPVLCVPGVARWHCLLVPAQRELQSEAWLGRQGVYAFHPVRYRTVIQRGRSRRIERRYLPGYVFARFSGPVRWHEVLGSQFISDVVRCSDGEPGYLRGEDLAALHAMRSVDLMTERQQQKAQRGYRRGRSSLRVGEQGLLKSGCLEGNAGEVIEILGGYMVLRLTFFGSQRDISVSSDLLAD